MKTKLILIATVFAALVSSAQTNSIIFPQLLSPTNSVLMTNAEFRCYSGAKIFFMNDAGYKAFYAADLNTNVLAALHISPAQLAAQQKKLDDAKQRNWAATHPDNSEIYETPATPVDDFFELAKKQLNACKDTTDLSDTSDRIIRSIDNSYSEIIDNAIIHDASATEINNLEIDRDREKLKVLNFTQGLEKKQLDQDNQAEAVAQSNLNAFHADPEGYLKTHPSSTNSTK